jgi:hypothetical protein
LDAREALLGERERGVDAREEVVDEREQAADWREGVADERESVADERRDASEQRDASDGCVQCCSSGPSICVNSLRRRMRGTVRRNFVTGPKRATRRLRCAPRNTDDLRPWMKARPPSTACGPGGDRDRAAADRADLSDIERDAADPTAQK